MIHRSQNLNDNPERKKLFHFRGWFYNKYHHSKVNYELCSGPACSLRFKGCYDGMPAWSFTFGLLFFTLYLTVPKPKFWKWGMGKQYGFYWHQWECRFFWGEKPMESGHGWHWYFKPIKLLFGRSIHYTGSEMYDNYQPIHFIFRGKEYQLDKVFIQNWYLFRTRVPFGLWHRGGTTLIIKIDKPPMHAGKGTTSYNCDDDGTYGLTCPYEGPKLNRWEDREKLYRYAVEYYCKSVHRDIKKRGRASGDTCDINDGSFEYIGIKPVDNSCVEVGGKK